MANFQISLRVVLLEATSWMDMTGDVAFSITTLEMAEEPFFFWPLLFAGAVLQGPAWTGVACSSHFLLFVSGSLRVLDLQV